MIELDCREQRHRRANDKGMAGVRVMTSRLEYINRYCWKKARTYNL